MLRISAFWAAAALVLSTLLAAISPARAAPPPASAFFHNPQFGSAKLSPDGQRVAFLVASQGGHARLGVLDLANGTANVAMSFTESDVGDFDWVNDQRLVFVQYAEHQGQGLFAVNHDGSQYRQLVESTLSFFKDPIEGRELLRWDTWLVHINSQRNSNDVWVVTPGQRDKDRGMDHFTLRRLDTLTGRSVELDTPAHAMAWLLDQRDQLRVVVTRQGDDGTVRWRPADGDWQTLYPFKPRSLTDPAPMPLLWGPDERLYVTATAFGDKAAVSTYDPVARRLADKPLLQSPDFDLRPAFITDGQRLLGVRMAVDGEVTHWFDDALKAQQAAIDQLLPATSNRVSAPLRPGQPWLLVQSVSDSQPPITQVYNTQTKKLTLLGKAHPAIQPQAMGQTDLVRLPARDGLSIPAWLTLPAGTKPDAKPQLPLVVMVHGGPWVRGRHWGWDAEVQFLASRGYAVLQPEFRGSLGYGHKHFRAGWQQWGQTMQDDLADAARWAIARGIADPGRIAIMGGSYGGYATLMGLVNNPELFRCGINYVGVTDIDLMFSVSWSDIGAEAKRYGMAQLIGDPVADAARFKTNSPLQQAKRITQPLLMAYGQRDQRVPLIHGEKLRDALRGHNKAVDWVVYPDEGHGWYRVDTRLDFWGRVERFLAQHLAPRTTGAVGSAASDSAAALARP